MRNKHGVTPKEFAFLEAVGGIEQAYRELESKREPSAFDREAMAQLSKLYSELNDRMGFDYTELPDPR